MQISKAGMIELEKELQYRLETLRPRFKQDLIEATDIGDLVYENFPYDISTMNLQMNEDRIAQLQELIRNSTVLKENTQQATIDIGSKVILTDEDNLRKELMLLAPNSPEVDPRQGKISTASALGSKLIGTKVGDIVKVISEIGTKSYTVNAIS